MVSKEIKDMRERIKEGEARIKANRLKKPIKEALDKAEPEPTDISEDIIKEEINTKRVKEKIEDEEYPNVEDVDLGEKEEEDSEEQEDNSELGGLHTYDDYSSSFSLVGLILPIIMVVIIFSVGLIVIDNLNEAIGGLEPSTDNTSIMGVFQQIAPFGSSALFLPLLLFPIILVFIIFNRFRC